MKTKLKISGLIGAMVLVVFLGVKPQSAKAQNKKEVKKTILIKNGDTIINGKNLKEVSKSERKKLLKELDGAEQVEFHQDLHASKMPKNGQVIIRKKVDGQPDEVIVRRMNRPGTIVWKDGADAPTHFKIDVDSFMVRFDGDSTMKKMNLRMAGLDSNMRRHFRMMAKDGDFEFFTSPDGPMPPHAPEGMNSMRAPAPPTAAFRMERPEAKNSQVFSYSNTDKDGISNRLHIRLNDANKEALKKITGSETSKTDLIVEDLSFFPSFSTGKLNLAFTLNSKAAVEVKILNSDFVQVFTDKLSGLNEHYYKSFSLPKNGVYYLSISQNGNWFIKKLIKE